MLTHKGYKRLLQELSLRESIELTLSYSPITIRVFDHGQKLALATSVYEGGNYIPKSVRQCLASKPPFSQSFLQTFLRVDEENYRISLNYLGSGEGINDYQFQGIIEEFNRMADKWRLHLDEHDKNDLVHVHVK